mgnify:CR=1 FL=1|tara:strand:+ start:1103 stop:1933 length:831 start_codon:yes stop_codon:yes gene_type:complete
MASFTGNPFSSFYKRIVQWTGTTNEGCTTSVKILTDGDGNLSSMQASDDQFVVRPQNDNLTTTFSVQSQAGSAVLVADTTNKKVTIGASQTAANTQYAHFGISATDTFWAACAADTHYAVPFNAFGAFPTSNIANLAMGSSTSSSFNDTNPATSLTISNTAMDIVGTYWYVMDDITIDAVKWLHGADTATGDSTAAHLMAYTVDTANGSTGGDLSSGVVVADSSTITNAGYEQVYYNQMTVQSADVDAGKVILFTFAADTVNSDFSINATVKYHIR